MKRTVLLSLVPLLLAGSARADEKTPAAEHELSVYLCSGAQLYLSKARTMGGLGGGVGVRDVWKDRYIFQADASYLFMVGNAAALRVAAGGQLSGAYSPAVLLTASLFLGDQLTFLQPGQSAIKTGPAFSLGLSVAPLRWRMAGTQVSVLELGISAGSDFPGLGMGYSVSLLEVSTKLD